MRLGLSVSDVFTRSGEYHRVLCLTCAACADVSVSISVLLFLSVHVPDPASLSRCFAVLHHPHLSFPHSPCLPHSPSLHLSASLSERALLQLLQSGGNDEKFLDERDVDAIFGCTDKMNYTLGAIVVASPSMKYNLLMVTSSCMLTLSVFLTL